MNNAGNADTYHAPHNDDWLNDEEDENRIIEWDVPVNIDAMNKEFMERSIETWDGIERDRWLYSFDTEDSIIPDFEKPLDRFKKRSDIEKQLFQDLGDDGDDLSGAVPSGGQGHPRPNTLVVLHTGEALALVVFQCSGLGWFAHVCKGAAIRDGHPASDRV